MKRIIILALSVLMVVLSISEANAQWQFCFGMSPGISKMFPSHPVEEITLPSAVSLTLQTGVNYSFSRKVSIMTFLSLSNYAGRFVPTWEGEWEGVYHYPLSKKVRINSSAGIAVAILNNNAGNLPEYINHVPLSRFNEDNLFIVVKSGLQWKVPGLYHSVYFGADYHLGMRKAHQVICYGADQSSPAITFNGRGSYLALNMIILIGKEKYSWKKTLSARDKAQMKRSFVM